MELTLIYFISHLCPITFYEGRKYSYIAAMDSFRLICVTCHYLGITESSNGQTKRYQDRNQQIKLY